VVGELDLPIAVAIAAFAELSWSAQDNPEPLHLCWSLPGLTSSMAVGLSGPSSACSYGHTLFPKFCIVEYSLYPFHVILFVYQFIHCFGLYLHPGPRLVSYICLCLLFDCYLLLA
jgi:hypothetical protein